MFQIEQLHPFFPDDLSAVPELEPAAAEFEPDVAAEAEFWFSVPRCHVSRSAMI